jgi:hypothetical protein
MADIARRQGRLKKKRRAVLPPPAAFHFFSQRSCRRPGSSRSGNQQRAGRGKHADAARIGIGVDPESIQNNDVQRIIYSLASSGFGYREL